MSQDQAGRGSSEARAVGGGFPGPGTRRRLETTLDLAKILLFTKVGFWLVEWLQEPWWTFRRQAIVTFLGPYPSLLQRFGWVAEALAAPVLGALLVAPSRVRRWAAAAGLGYGAALALARELRLNLEPGSLGSGLLEAGVLAAWLVCTAVVILRYRSRPACK